MKTFQKITFYVFGAFCLGFGAGLLLVPGRFLGLVNWAPIDPLLSRLMGAALLALTWLDWRVIRTADLTLVSTGVEVFFITSLLGSIGLLRHLLIANYPAYVWILAIGLLIFSVIFAILWLSLKPRVSGAKSGDA
jgi:hypothetical protein